MYTLSQIRRRVDALKRKYASDLTVIRLRPLAEDYCLLWTEAMTDGNSPPDSYAFIRHIARQGFRLNSFTGLHLYLERCRENGRNPNTIGIVAALLPEVRPARLEELLLDDSDDAERPPLAGGESPASVATWIPAWIWDPRVVARLFAGLINGTDSENRYSEDSTLDSLPIPRIALPDDRPRRNAGMLALAHCHPNPANAKLPPTPCPRDAIRHPLRC